MNKLKGTKYITTYIFTDYMKPSLRKDVFLLKNADGNKYAISFLPARRFWQNLFDADFLAKMIEAKGSSEYKNYEYISHNGEYYAGKGFIAGEKYLSDNIGAQKLETRISVDNIPKEWKQTIKEMIAYCSEHDVQLTFTAVPVSFCYMSSNGYYETYDSFVQLVNDLIDETGVEYLDFNLAREEYWNNSNQYFQDYNHLNKDGADYFSRLLASYMNGEISYSDLFYDSLEEKKEYLPAQIYGIGYEIEDSENIKCTILHSGSIAIESSLFDENGEKYMTDDSENSDEFYVPAGYVGKCVLQTVDNDGKAIQYEIELNFNNILEEEQSD